MNPKNQISLIVILAVLLIIAVGYIVKTEVQERQMEEQLNVFQSGMQAGYQQAIVQLIQDSEDCQVVPVRIANISRSFVDTSCVRRS